MSSRSFPRSITIFGFANTALGAGGLVSGLSALLQPRMTVAENVYQQVNLPSQSLEWLHWAMVLSPLSSALMLVCGIGLLRKKTWGRTLAIGYGYGSIAFSLIASSINIWRIADRAHEPLILNIIFSIVLSVLFGLLYKAAMVYSLTRPKVKTALVNQPVGAEILEFKPVQRQRSRD
ncbi:hypothetical protein IQ266_05460 [filamentous cyanobacterium LEGE 11480]|uniref:Uncharacterized protein n=1 Tax=Romeriopsis navalis LEGE 11480 TaxID=2777977 RepID=A0A928Z262_9CYAN|nr:hypothetical protein [Romeriopsis navalis]MBE9029209.1 hypothetical protein [Romeriopsis navalis LEGE 11480]